VGGELKCEGDRIEVTIDIVRPSSFSVGGGNEGGGVCGRAGVGVDERERVSGSAGGGRGDSGLPSRGVDRPGVVDDTSRR
jgi:hypothetical protein